MSYQNLDVDKGNDDHKLADQVKLAGLGSQMSSVIRSQTLNAVCNTAVPNAVIRSHASNAVCNTVVQSHASNAVCNTSRKSRASNAVCNTAACCHSMRFTKLFAIAFLPDGGNHPRLPILYNKHPSFHFCLTEVLHSRPTGKWHFCLTPPDRGNHPSGSAEDELLTLSFCSIIPSF